MFPGNLTKKMLRIFFNPPFPSQVTIDGEDVENMNQLVRQVAYLNTRCHHYNFKNTIMFFLWSTYTSLLSTIAITMLITITMTTLHLLSSALLHFFRAKSSSSRFTTSDKYENLFQVRTTSLQISEMLDIRAK